MNAARVRAGERAARASEREAVPPREAVRGLRAPRPRLEGAMKRIGEYLVGGCAAGGDARNFWMGVGPRVQGTDVVEWEGAPSRIARVL